MVNVFVLADVNANIFFVFFEFGRCYCQGLCVILCLGRCYCLCCVRIILADVDAKWQMELPLNVIMADVVARWQMLCHTFVFIFTG